MAGKPRFTEARRAKEERQSVKKVWIGLLEWIQQKRNQTDQKLGPVKWVCPQCKSHEALRENHATKDEYCAKCKMHWDGGYFIGWNIGWIERGELRKKTDGCGQSAK